MRTYTLFFTTVRTFGLMRVQERSGTFRSYETVSSSRCMGVSCEGEFFRICTRTAIDGTTIYWLGERDSHRFVYCDDFSGSCFVHKCNLASSTSWCPLEVCKCSNDLLQSYVSLRQWYHRIHLDIPCDGTDIGKWRKRHTFLSIGEMIIIFLVNCYMRMCYKECMGVILFSETQTLDGHKSSQHIQSPHPETSQAQPEIHVHGNKENGFL